MADTTSESVIAKPCWICLKAWPLNKRKCSCGRKLSRQPSFVSLEGTSLVFLHDFDSSLRDDGSYTVRLSHGKTSYRAEKS